MRIFPLLFFILTGCSSTSTVEMYILHTKDISKRQSVIAKASWLHGASNCAEGHQPVHDVYAHDADTFIIRQNKCFTYEAPFIYVLVGEEKILVLDTGAIKTDANYSLYDELKDILGKEQLQQKELLVMHSHGHSDHFQGDLAFLNKPRVTLVETSITHVQNYFAFHAWPLGEKTIDLGARTVTVLPTPGHQEAAITLYDDKTKWLLTGDTFYPGMIIVKHWNAYRESIKRLTEFVKNHEVTAILGAHIEMTNQPSLFYPVGTTYQPNEAPLDLPVSSLLRLNAVLQTANTPTHLTFDEFIVRPMTSFQKTLSNLMNLFVGKN